MNHLVLSEKDLSRNQFLSSTSQTGLYLLEPIIDGLNLGDTIALLQDLGISNEHNITIECQNSYISLKQYMRYHLLNEKLSHDVAGLDYPLVRFKDQKGLNIWENFESQNKYGGSFTTNYLASSYNIDNGVIILINDLKIINGGSVDSDQIYLKCIFTTGQDCNFTVRFSKNKIRVINNYNNSQIGLDIVHDFSEEHTFLIAIKYDAGLIKMGFHFHGVGETVFTNGFYDSNIFQGSGGTSEIKFSNGISESNHSCSLYSIDTYIDTGLSFISSIPSGPNLNKIYNNFTFYDTIIDTKISSSSLHTNFQDTVYVKKYDSNKLIICYLLFKSTYSTNYPLLYFIIYDKLTDTFTTKKIVETYQKMVDSTVNVSYTNLSKNYILKINVVGTRIFLSVHIFTDEYDKVSHIFSDDLGTTWKSCSKLNGSTYNEGNGGNPFFAISNRNPFSNGYLADSDFEVANDGNALLEASSYERRYKQIIDMAKDTVNNDIWCLGYDTFANGYDFPVLIHFDVTLDRFGTEYQFPELYKMRRIQIIGNYLFLSTEWDGGNSVIKVDINNPNTFVKKESFYYSFRPTSAFDNFSGAVTNDGTYLYYGYNTGGFLKIDQNLNVISSYTITLPVNKRICGLDHNSNDNSLWFVTNNAGFIYKISNTFTGETQYALTGYSGIPLMTDVVVYEVGNYVFIADNNNSAGKVLRISTTGLTPISSALSVNADIGFGRIFVSATYVFISNVNGFDRFGYPTLTGRSTFTKPVNTSYSSMYYDASLTRMFMSLVNTLDSVFTFESFIKILVTALPPSIETSYRQRYAKVITVKSHTNINEQVRDLDKRYLYYNNGIGVEDYNFILYGKLVENILLDPAHSIDFSEYSGLVLFKIPSSNNFVLIYAVGSNLYGQQINFNGVDFSFSGSPVFLCSFLVTPKISFYKAIDIDSSPNIYYIIYTDSLITYVLYNSSGNLLSGWSQIANYSLNCYSNSIFMMSKSFEYFNDNIIRLYGFSNPFGYNEILPYNFILLQSTIKDKKPSTYFPFKNNLVSYCLSSNILNSFFSGDSYFRLYDSYSPKTVLDSNSINKQADGVFSEITDNILVKFGGSKMYDFDKIYILSDYQIKGDEIASTSPSEIWKSESDGGLERIIFDATLTNNSSLKFVFNSFALLNVNFEHAKILACNDGDFNTPDFSFDLYSYVTDTNSFSCEDVDGNYIKLSTQLAFPSLFKYIGKNIIIKTGTISGNVYKIINSDGFGIYVNDDVETAGLLASDTFKVFGDRMFNINTNFNLESSISRYRYIAVEIPAQKTYEGYYIIGKLLIGLALKLKYARSIPYSDSFSSGTEINRSIGKQSYPITNSKDLFSTSISFNKLRSDGKNELLMFVNYIEFNRFNLIFLNDISKLNDFNLVRLDGDFEFSHELGDDSIFTTSINLVEEL